VCGNIGRAICEVAEDVDPSGLLVAEVSSFQLETVERLKPFVAVWLNSRPIISTVTAISIATAR
jgi:UDP-N-acetylmuramoylalanine--D-glutamate ligase